jgi:hypothetical protein
LKSTRLQRQPQHEAGAAWGVFQFQTAVMGLCQGATQSQSYACALLWRFCAEEGFKNPVAYCGGHARAIIGNAEDDVTVLSAE